ncbi:MAG: hypothetical protein IJG53_01355 [Eggerthellaceae bacterium]|nr:hypothetical protein [Eggerthellaceae bacterium]
MTRFSHGKGTKQGAKAALESPARLALPSGSDEPLQGPPGGSPEVVYADASKLDRPQRHSWKHAIFIFLCFLAGIGVSAFGGWKAYEAIVIGPELELARTIEALTAEVDYNLPHLLDVIDLGDAEMVAKLTDDGNRLVFLEEFPENPEESEGFDMYRIPEAVSTRTAEGYLESGISTLKRSQAAPFLNGSWRYTVYRYLACAVRLQYADFTVTTPEDAFTHCMELQGWIKPVVAAVDEDGNPIEGAQMTEIDGEEEEEIPLTLALGETGKDSNGNYYQVGNIITDDGRHYEFRISTVTVEEMYGLNLPVEGMFVGLRLTQIILKD